MALFNNAIYVDSIAVHLFFFSVFDILFVFGYLCSVFVLWQLKASVSSKNFSCSRNLNSFTQFKPSNSNIKRKICVLGGGSWGTAVADIISNNAIKFPEYFNSEVMLYLRDVNLCSIIEQKRENTKYLPNIRLQSNLKPVTSLEDALFFADIVIFAIPHEYINEICCKINNLHGFVRSPIGVSLIKGLQFDANGNLERISQLIERMIGIKVGVLSGANVAIEVAKRQYCEATLCPPKTGDKHLEHILLALFNTSFFKVSFSDDQATVEICGALKNVIACGAGLVDGLGFGINTKSALIACGFRELSYFVRLFNPKFNIATLFSSCGIADVIASSFGGRNRKVGEAFVCDNSDLSILEEQLLKGQKLQGPNTAKSVYRLLKQKDQLKHFPLFASIHLIFNEGHDPLTVLDAIRAHY